MSAWFKPGPTRIASLCTLLLLSLLCGCERQKPATEARIVLTSDIRGRLVPCGCFTGQLGGMTRLHTFLEHNATPLELRVDCGDALQGTQDFEILEYVRILEAFHKMDFAALNIGAREAELPLDTLLEMQAKSEVPMISANLYRTETNAAVLPTHTRAMLGGKKVIITGIVHPSAMTDYELGDGLSIAPPELALRALLPKLRKECDLLVLLALADEDKLRQLADQFYEADFILGGDVSQPSGSTRKVNQSHVFYVANESRTIGLIDFSLKAAANGRDSIVIKNARPELMYEEIPEAQAILNIAESYREMIRRTKLDVDSPETFQTGMVPGIRPPATYTGTESCIGCHQEEHAIWKDTGHAHAWKSLKYTKADADPNCIGCHSVGFGTVSGYRREFEHEKLIDVGCESCHGPGSQHVAERSSGGPVRQRFRPLAEGDCRTCHFGEFSRPFVWEEFWPQVAHGKKVK
ncbi:MAG: multiheme c-type cytochrome [Opitutales bacterium]